MSCDTDMLLYGLTYFSVILCFVWSVCWY